jgi:hypothetical protein
MNFDYTELINPYLLKGDFSKALEIAETSLKNIPETEFHKVLGKFLLNHTDALVSWIDDFYNKTQKIIQIKAMYFEINEFDINTDQWYIDGFAYKEYGGTDDYDWLSDVTKQTMTSNEFILHGYEALQDAFENIELETDDLQNARDWCEQIIITRYMELMRNVHLKAKEMKLEWASIPLLCTEHSYDFIYESVN